MKEIRSDIELLQVLLDNTHKIGNVIPGLCILSAWLVNLQLVTDREHRRITDIIQINKPERLGWDDAYYWPQGEIPIRRDFIKRLITKLTEKEK